MRDFVQIQLVVFRIDRCFCRVVEEGDDGIFAAQFQSALVNEAFKFRPGSANGCTHLIKSARQIGKFIVTMLRDDLFELAFADFFSGLRQCFEWHFDAAFEQVEDKAAN